MELFKGYPNLIAEIEACGCQMMQLSQLTSIPEDRLCSIAGAYTDPDLNEMFILAKFFGVDFNYLASHKPTKPAAHVTYREKVIPLLNEVRGLNTILRDAQIPMPGYDVENYHVIAEAVSKCENLDIAYAEFNRLQRAVHNLRQHIDSTLRCRARIALIRNEPEQARTELLRCYDLLDERGKVDLLGNAQSNVRLTYSQNETTAECA